MFVYLGKKKDLFELKLLFSASVMYFKEILARSNFGGKTIWLVEFNLANNQDNIIL